MVVGKPSKSEETNKSDGSADYYADAGFDVDSFGRFMDASKKRIIKLELLDSYAGAFDGEAKMLRKFLKRGISRKELYDSLGKDYESTRRLARRGVKFIRIHVVSMPVSDYIRLEIESYKMSERYGEKIYFAKREDFEAVKRRSKLKIIDFLVFDSDVVMLNNFRTDKRHNAVKYLGTAFVEDKKLAKRYADFWRRLLKKSIPMRAFIKGEGSARA